MTEAELRTETLACGLDHLSTTRVDQFILFAARKLYYSHLWPFRLTTQTGVAPLTVTTRGPIKSVFDSNGYEIDPADQDELGREVDLTTSSGDATAWYLTDAGAVQTYPASTPSITVRHYASVPATTALILADIPSEFHYSVIFDAVRRGKLDNGELEVAASYKADYDESLNEMRRVLFNDQVQGPKRRNNV